MNKKTPFKSGFIAIIGAPNVGKSTLLNQLLGQKIAITSEKPQTTRHRILGIAHLPGAQLIFLDTPGVHKAKGPLNVRMVEVALKVLGDADLVVFVADGTSTNNVSDEIILESLKKTNLPSILAINKVDLLQKEKLLPLIEQWDEAYPFRTIVPISALHRTQVDKLLSGRRRNGRTRALHRSRNDPGKGVPFDESGNSIRGGGDGGVLQGAFREAPDRHPGHYPRRTGISETDDHRQGRKNAKTDRGAGQERHRTNGRMQGIFEALGPGSEEVDPG
jgi:small GTP-binding protein